MNAMKELYLQVAADSTLQDKVNDIFEEAGEDADIAGNKLVEFAGEQGYTVTIKEIGEFFKAVSVASDNQMSFEELDIVAGGKIPGQGGGAILSGNAVGPFVFVPNCGPAISVAAVCRFNF
jgi:hypothetical protein